MAAYSIKYGLLPTQIPIGDGPYDCFYSVSLNQTIPYYKELISKLSITRTRLDIPDYPQINVIIRQAIEQIYDATKEPNQAPDEAACKGFRMVS